MTQYRAISTVFRKTLTNILKIKLKCLLIFFLYDTIDMPTFYFHICIGGDILRGDGRGRMYYFFLNSERSTMLNIWVFEMV